MAEDGHAGWQGLGNRLGTWMLSVGRVLGRIFGQRALAAGIVAAALGVLISGVFGTMALTHTALFAPRAARPTATPVPSATPAATLAALPAGNDWTQYRFDLAGTGANPEKQIDVSNVAQLKDGWSVYLGRPFYAGPAIVDGVVYVTNDQSLHAYNLLTGRQIWHFDGLPEDHAAISSSVAVDSALHLAFYGDSDGGFFAVDIQTGELAWHRQLSTENGADIWSSALILDGTVYTGIASKNDNPCVRGALHALDERTGDTRWTHFTVPPGVLGATIWSSPIANPARHEIIVTTGNPCPEGPVVYEEDAIVGINMQTGATLWQYRALEYDGCDCDFGEGAIDAVYQGREYIVAGNKYGGVYTVARDSSGGTPTLAWKQRIARTGFLDQGGIFEPPAYGDGLVFVAGGPPAGSSDCPVGSLHAFHIESGAEAWHVCTKGQVVSPAALTGGVLFVAQRDALVAYEASSGRALASFPQPGSHWGSVAISHGVVVNGGVNGWLYTYSLPAPAH